MLISTILDNYNVKEYKLCDTSFSQFRGMMFNKNPKTLVFKLKKPQTILIHTFFIKYRLLVILLNENSEIKYIRTLDKNKIFNYNQKISTIIEIPLKS